MNIQEAATCVKNGECTAAVSLATGRPFTFNGYTFGFHGGYAPRLEEILGDWELVNPTPKTEEVEVKIQVGIYPDGGYHIMPNVWNDKWPIVECVGHYPRPVPRKVIKREKLSEVSLNGTDMYYLNPQRFPQLKGKQVDIFAEWPEDEI